MPELPEVETIRNLLEKSIKGKKIIALDILDKRIPFNSPLPLSDLINQTLVSLGRKGKYLLFNFEDYILVSHLRMEGKYYLYEEEEENSKFARIIFHLDSKQKLIYDDVRRFGIMELYHKNDINKCKALNKLGPEPWDLDDETLYSSLHKLNKEIKTCLLSQDIISGIGNIYADEILFLSEISPFRKASSLSLKEVSLILKNARQVLEEAIKCGGSTIRSYHPSRNMDGRFQQNLNVYDKKNEPCPRCGKKLLKTFLHGRGTTYCPNCQHTGKVIGIYGKIASGKSTLLSFFKKDNYPCFSADEEVADIYKNDLNFTLFCVNNFKEEVLNASGKVSKEYVRQVIMLSESKRKILEGYLHEAVILRAENFIKLHREDPLIVLEIPLLFESKMEGMFDYIIGLDATYLNQIENLKRRKAKNIANYLKINNSPTFDKNLKKCDYIINNNSSLEDLKKAYKEIEQEILNS